MNYYILSNSTDEKIVGCYPQTDGMAYEYDLNKPTSVWNIPAYEIPTFEPDLDFFKLDRKAKLTDVISTGTISSPGFLINEKVKLLFEQFNLPKHIYYPAKVMHQVQKLDYYWFQIGEDIVLNDIIDFSKSEFELRHPLPWKKDSTKLDVHSTNDLIKVRKEQTDIKKIFPVQLYLHSKLINYSMFAFSTFWNKIIISEQFKNQIESNKISGFETKPAFPICFN